MTKAARRKDNFAGESVEDFIAVDPWRSPRGGDKAAVE